MPRVLSKADIADFRERLCEVAERLFAGQGLDAVTMRQLAVELGVSPMTPYRYFKDKDEILAAVRTNGFNRFADKMDAAFASATTIAGIGEALGDAYVDFAVEHPQAYKLMFDLNQPNEDQYPALSQAVLRSRHTQAQYFAELVAEGELVGDPVEVGYMFWAAVHGIVGLELAGKVPHGSARKLHRQITSAMRRGLMGIG